MRAELREWIIALSILAFSLFTQFYLIPNQVECLEEFEIQSFSPRFFPGLAAWIITGLAGLLILIRIVHKPPTPTVEKQRLTVLEELKVVGTFVIAIIYLLAFKYIGFILATFLGLGALLSLQGGLRRPFKTVCFNFKKACAQTPNGNFKPYFGSNSC